MEEDLAASIQPLDLLAQARGLLFGGLESLGESSATSPFSDVLDKVGDLALESAQFSGPQTHRLGHVGGGPGDLLFHAPQDILQILGAHELIAHCSEDDAFDQHSADEQAIFTAALGGREAAVVAPRLAADLCDRVAAHPTGHRAREKLPRVYLHASGPSRLEPTFGRRTSRTGEIMQDGHVPKKGERRIVVELDPLGAPHWLSDCKEPDGNEAAARRGVEAAEQRGRRRHSRP